MKLPRWPETLILAVIVGMTGAYFYAFRAAYNSAYAYKPAAETNQARFDAALLPNIADKAAWLDVIHVYACEDGTFSVRSGGGIEVRFATLPEAQAEREAWAQRCADRIAARRQVSDTPCGSLVE